MRVRIHRGASQVGGNCVELEADGRRLLLDLGMPLDAEEGEMPMPDVPGIRGGDPTLLGVVISHLHGDHCGLVPYASPDLPVAMGPIGVRILEEAEFFTGRHFGIRLRWPLVHGERFGIGPFSITPIQVEHSAFDSFALLVEADGRRLFYTGDFRAHGNDREPFERLLREAPKGVDVLLMEGTQIGGGREGNGPSEADLQETLAQRFKEWPGIVLVAWSAQNLDRMRTLYQAAREVSRTLVVDLYAATIARAARAPRVPVPVSEGLAVYCRRRERVQVKEAQAFERTGAIYRWRVFPEVLARRASSLVLRPSMLDELERAGALEGALAIWSLWRGYLEGPSERRMLARFETLRVPLEIHHVSGHAYVSDLQRLAAAMAPGRIIPIHTEEPERSASFFSSVELRRDGEWWDV